MSFRSGQTVRFSQVDPAGIVFFSRYFEICHHAFEDLLTAALGPWFDRMVTEGWVLPLVHAEADYLAPARLGEALTVRVDLLRRGESSLTLGFEVEGADGSPRARIQHVHACIGREGQQPIPLPESLVAAFAKVGLEPPAEL